MEVSPTQAPRCQESSFCICSTVPDCPNHPHPSQHNQECAIKTHPSHPIGGKVPGVCRAQHMLSIMCEQDRPLRVSAS